ncbi:hypothetical protein [Methylocella sp.]|uniref:hypothetical protein n=1 Tax=Methylocella sp. TaxID=1978226 RepID=UPI00378487BF
MAKRLTKCAAPAAMDVASPIARAYAPPGPDRFIIECDKRIEAYRAAGYDCGACASCAFLDCRLAGALRLKSVFSGETKKPWERDFAWVRDTLPPKQDEPRKLLEMERDGTRWGRA